MQVDISERSRYLDTSASEVARAWRRHTLVTNVVSGVAVLVLALSFLVQEHPSPLSFIGTLLGYACVFLAQWLVKGRETTEVMKIATHDSDPAKLAQVIDVMLPHVRDRRSKELLSASYATCSVLMGYDDVALAWVAKVEQGAPKRKDIQLSLVNTRLAAAGRAKDKAALAFLRDQALAIERESRQGTPLEKNANLVICSANRALAFLAGDWARVREFVGSIEALASTPQAVCTCEFHKGELEDALGNVQQAWQHYAFVANQGGTTLAHDRAVAWLDAHDPRKAAETPVLEEQAPEDVIEEETNADSRG